MAKEIVLSETQKEVVYALLNRQQDLQKAFQKLQGAINEQADMLARMYEVEGDRFTFRVKEDEVMLVGIAEENIEEEE